MSLLDLLIEPEPEPHPDLVAAQRPTTRDFLMAASVLGWWPHAYDPD